MRLYTSFKTYIQLEKCTQNTNLCLSKFQEPITMNTFGNAKTIIFVVIYGVIGL